jgi:hypothetical protein
MPLRQLASRLIDVLSTPTGGTDPTRRLLGGLRRYEQELWFLALSAMLIDVTLTIHGLQLGLSERNPVAQAALESAGAVGLYLLKFGAVLAGLCCRTLVPNTCTVIVPIALAIPSVFAVLINATLIVVVLQ